MKTVLVLLLVLMSCAPRFASVPPAVQTNIVAANRAWPGFYRAFRAAVNRRDRSALKKMMPDDFFDGGGGLTPAEWLAFIDENAKNGSWRDLQRSFAAGTVIHKEWTKERGPTRVTKDRGYYFEFRKDRRWYFAGVAGD